MRALLHYVLLKTVRSQFTVMIVLTPLVLTAAPVLGLLGEAYTLGRRLYPFALKGVSAAQTLSGFSEIAAGVAAAGGGAAAFWIFRSEIADKSIGALVLATTPLKICATAIAYGIVAGALSFAIAMPVFAALTAAAPPNLGALITSMLLLTAAMSSLGVALAAISADPGMLIPLPIATAVLALPMFEGMRVAAAVATVTFLALPIVAARLLERRCAA